MGDVIYLARRDQVAVPLFSHKNGVVYMEPRYGFIEALQDRDVQDQLHLLLDRLERASRQAVHDPRAAKQFDDLAEEVRQLMQAQSDARRWRALNISRPMGEAS